MASAVSTTPASSPLDPFCIKAESLHLEIISGRGLLQTFHDDYPDLNHQLDELIIELLSGIDKEVTSLRTNSDFTTYNLVRAHCLFYFQFTDYLCKPDDLYFADKIILNYGRFF